MSFFTEYIRHPLRIGAVASSSHRLAKKMAEPIEFSRCECIVEYGPGTGVFTNEIVMRKRRDTIFIVIEQNRTFYENLKRKYKGCSNVRICHGDASRVKDYLDQYKVEHVDYIISGLPFASLPQEVSTRILNATKDVIGATGTFITFQYTLFKKKVFLKSFRIEKITFEAINFPPAFVLKMKGW